MAFVLQIPTQDTIRRVQRIQTVTIVWMTVEAAVALSAAWMARSPALLAFGGDSAIELFSAIVVLWRFRTHAAQEQSERHAARIAAVLLFMLAAYVAVASVMTLLGHSEPKTTYLGIAILIAAAAIMPWLAKEKRKLSAITGSAALRADAAESALCAYLSLVALAGLGVNAIWHLRWADPIAALVIVPLILREGWEAMRGKACGCC
ncbi:MAG: cation transporter [Terriglobales bacterium]